MTPTSSTLPLGTSTFVQRGFQVPQSLGINPSVLSGAAQPSRPAAAVTPDSISPPQQRHSESHTGSGNFGASYFKAPWTAPDSLAESNKLGRSREYAERPESDIASLAGRSATSAHDDFTEALQSLVSQQQQRSHAHAGVSSSHWAWTQSNASSTTHPSSAFLRSTSGDQPLTLHTQHAKHNKSASGGFDFRGQAYNFHGYSPTSPKSQHLSLSPSLLGLSSTSEPVSLQQAQAILARQLASSSIGQDRPAIEAEQHVSAADRQANFPFTATSPRSAGAFSSPGWSVSEQLTQPQHPVLHHPLSASASTVATDQQSLPPSRIFSPSHTAPSSVGSQSLPASDFSASLNLGHTIEEPDDIMPSKRSSSAGRKRPTSMDRESGRGEDTDTAERHRGRKSSTGGKWPPQSRASRSKTRKLNTARTNSPRGAAAPEGRVSADGTSTNNVSTVAASEPVSEANINVIHLPHGSYSRPTYSTSLLQYSSIQVPHQHQHQHQHQPIQSESLYACSNASEEAINAAPRYLPPAPSYFPDSNSQIPVEAPVGAWPAHTGTAHRYEAVPPLAPFSHEPRFPTGLDAYTAMSTDNSPIVGFGLPLPDESFPNVLRQTMDSTRHSPPLRDRDDEDDIREEKYPPTEDRRKKRRESHNMVERRRRDNINDRITELAALLPDMLLEYAPHSVDGDVGGRPMKCLPTGLPAGSPPMPVTSLSLTPAQIAQQNSSSKPNKGVILSKSVEYIRYLQQIVSLQADRNRVLETKLKGVEARPVLPNHLLRHQATLTQQKAASSGTGSQTGSTGMSDSPSSIVGAHRNSASPSMECDGPSVVLGEQIYGDVVDSSISEIFARYGCSSGKMADIEEALGE